MIMEEASEEHLKEYVEMLDKLFGERIKFINETFSDLYSGNALFQYSIDIDIEEILKNQYEIDGGS